MHQLIILLANLIYLPAIWYGLISDDATEMKMCPYNVKKSKIASIILHIIVAQFVYIAFGANFASFMAALMFSLHPAAIQIPVWRAGRYYGYNALIVLLSIAFMPFTFPLYFFSLLSIASTMFVPLIFLFTDYWFLAVLCPILIGLSYKHIKGNIIDKIKGTNNIYSNPLPDDYILHKFHLTKLIIAVKTFGFYVLSALLPVKNGFYNSFLVTLGMSKIETKYWYSLNRHFWGGLLAIIAMLCIWCFNMFNFIGMGIMIFVLALIPFMNFITVQQFTAPRYAYLPLIGFHIALASLLLNFGIVGFAICCVLLGFYIAQMLRVMPIYKKDSLNAIVKDSHEFPDNPRVWYYRYERALHKGNAVVAWSEANWGLKYLPYDCQLWFALACASFELGDMNSTEKFLKNSEKYMLLVGRGDMQILVNDLRRRIKLKLEGKYLK